MNKILKISIVVVLCLIVVLMITLFACNQTGGNNGDDKTTTTTTTTKKPEPCTEHVDTDDDGKCDVCGTDMPKASCTEHVDADDDGKCDKCGEEMPKTPVSSDFTEANDTVYVIAGALNVRTSPNADDSDNIKTSVKYGEALKRTGFSEDGWTRIDVDGVAFYVSSTYVVTEKPILESDFKDVDDVVYVTNEEGLTMRSTPYYNANDNYNSVDYCKYGDSIKRTGIATRTDSQGITWSRLEIEDNDGNTIVVYASSKHLSTEDPTKVDTDNGIKFEKSYDIITVKATSFILRNAAIFDDSTKADSVGAGTKLQAIAKGTGSDGTVWYKVEHEGEIYYIIYNTTFVTCAEYKNETKTIKVYDDKVSITLPTYFVKVAEDNLGHYYESSDALVVIGYVENENKEIKSATDLANATIAGMEFTGDAPTVNTYKGVVYFGFSTTSTDSTTGEKSTVVTVVTFVKGSGEGYAVVEFHCDEADYDSLDEDFLNYATSITVK